MTSLRPHEVQSFQTWFLVRIGQYYKALEKVSKILFFTIFRSNFWSKNQHLLINMANLKRNYASPINKSCKSKKFERFRTLLHTFSFSNSKNFWFWWGGVNIIWNRTKMRDLLSYTVVKTPYLRIWNELRSKSTKCYILSILNLKNILW